MPTSTSKDYYGILGLSRTATCEDIKGAYKSLALKWHPDRHETNKEDAARKFIEINEAYRFLSDQARRRWYDNSSIEKTRGRHNPKPSANDAYSTKTPKPHQSEESFASGGLKVPTGTAFPSTKAKSDPGLRDAPNKDEGLKVPGGPPQHATSEAGLHEHFSHSRNDIPPPSHRSSIRAKSEGNRAQANEDHAVPSLESKTRPKSSGGKIEADLKGFIRRMSGGTKKSSPKGPPSFSSQKATIYGDDDDEIPFRDVRGELHTTTYPSNEIPAEWIFPLPLTLEELYEGASHRYRITRHLLSGKKKDVMVEIDVGSGWKKGTKIRFTGAGNEREGNTPQDVVFVVEEIPHQTFVREGSTLITRVKISLLEALAGEGRRIQIIGLDGKPILIETPPEIIRPGDECVIEGAGMPIRKHGKIVGRGDMVVRWDIEFPQRLTKEQKRDLERALRH